MRPWCRCKLWDVRPEKRDAGQEANRPVWEMAGVAIVVPRATADTRVPWRRGLTLTAAAAVARRRATAAAARAGVHRRCRRGCWMGVLHGLSSAGPRRRLATSCLPRPAVLTEVVAREPVGFAGAIRSTTCKPRRDPFARKRASSPTRGLSARYAARAASLGESCLRAPCAIRSTTLPSRTSE